MPVRWPFGHGLSYTGYVYRGAALDADTLTPGGTVTVRVTVKNSGAMRGAEVVQLYVADATGAPVPGGRVPQALRRFAKIDLQPGEEQEIVFMLTPQDISRYSPELHAWCAAPGRYEIRIGHSSRDIRAVLALQYADAKIELIIKEMQLCLSRSPNRILTPRFCRAPCPSWWISGPTGAAPAR